MRSEVVWSVIAASARLACSQTTSSKRGLCYVSSKTADKDDKIWDSDTDLTWYYNYAATPLVEYNDKLEYVPMLWGASSSGSDNSFYDTVKGLIDSGMNISHVLGFNEPDGCKDGGSCVDAQTAAEIWIREIEPLKELEVKLGAPAVIGAPTGFTWLQSFFTNCAGECTPDFLPVHWYGNFEGLASHIGQMNATYQNISSMWVTEYAYSHVDLQQTQYFFNQSANFFDRLPYITRVSYFGAFRTDKSNVGPHVAMLTKKGTLTDIGAWYLGKAETNEPEGSASTTAKFAGWSFVVISAAFWAMA